jgi:hypothetical protein
VDLHDLTTVLTAEGPFDTVLVDSRSDADSLGSAAASQ